MGSNDSGLKEYIRSIRRELPCSGKKKRQFISQIRCSIMDFLQENPEADLEAVQAHFGTKQEIVEDFVRNEDASNLLRKMSIKKKVLAIIAGVMIFITVTWGAVVIWNVIETKKYSEAYIEVVVETD